MAKRDNCCQLIYKAVQSFQVDSLGGYTRGDEAWLAAVSGGLSAFHADARQPCSKKATPIPTSLQANPKCIDLEAIHAEIWRASKYMCMELGCDK